MKIHYKELIVGALAASALLFPWHDWLEPKPYKDVAIVSVVKDSDYSFVVTANFVKVGCTYKRLEVAGISLAKTTTTLTWQDLDQVDTGDRSTGSQTLSIRVLTGGDQYDKFEIRTRHDCNGKTVDKVFATLEGTY